MAANLEDVPSLDLMHELLRRMKCSSKPDKHLILIGTGGPLLLPAPRRRRRLRAFLEPPGGKGCGLPRFALWIRRTFREILVISYFTSCK
jgi:hypothetical protein